MEDEQLPIAKPAKPRGWKPIHTVIAISLGVVALVGLSVVAAVVVGYLGAKNAKASEEELSSRWVGVPIENVESKYGHTANVGLQKDGTVVWLRYPHATIRAYTNDGKPGEAVFHSFGGRVSQVRVVANKPAP